MNFNSRYWFTIEDNHFHISLSRYLHLLGRNNCEKRKKEGRQEWKIHGGYNQRWRNTLYRRCNPNYMATLLLPFRHCFNLSRSWTESGGNTLIINRANVCLETRATPTKSTNNSSFSYRHDARTIKQGAHNRATFYPWGTISTPFCPRHCQVRHVRKKETEWRGSASPCWLRCCSSY